MHELQVRDLFTCLSDWLVGWLSVCLSVCQRHKSTNRFMHELQVRGLFTCLSELTRMMFQTNGSSDIINYYNLISDVKNLGRHLRK